jgi:hypothetical protein
MDLHYSIKDLDIIEAQVNRSIKVLEELGTIISGQHQLSIIKNLIDENRQLRDELVKRNVE